MFASDGSVTGTTNFGGSSSPMLLQYVGEVGDDATEGSWVLAIKTELGELVDGDSSFETPLDFQSPVIVFSAVSVDIDSQSMSASGLSFYGELHQSNDFTVRIERGVNVLTVATIADDSIPADLLQKAGIELPEIQIEGVLFGEFTDDTLDEWKTEEKDDDFWRDLREGIMLRATLPQIVIDGLPPNLIPPNLIVGDASLIWQSPGTEHDQIYLNVDLDMLQSDGSVAELSGRLGIAESSTVTEFRLSATATGIENAFGVTGLDLDEVKLLIAVNTVKTPADGEASSTNVSPNSVPTVAVGVLADMDLNGRHVSIAGRVDGSIDRTGLVPVIRLSAWTRPLSLGRSA